MPSSDIASFKNEYRKAKKVVVLTGAGASAESGVPTFRGAGGYWRQYSFQDLASPEAFRRNSSLVWEFYHYRRELVITKQPNPAHFAITKSQQDLKKQGKNLTIITQNIDGLHQAAGAEDVLELHGSLFQVRCLRCHKETENRDSPICESLSGTGLPDPGTESAKIPSKQLPRCKDCGGLLRPAVVWFGEPLNHDILEKAYHAFENCEMCLVVGTSSVVYPAAMFAPTAASRGATVAEFNLEPTEATVHFGYHFQGPCGKTLPEAILD